MDILFNPISHFISETITFRRADSASVCDPFFSFLQELIPVRLPESRIRLQNLHVNIHTRTNLGGRVGKWSLIPLHPRSSCYSPKSRRQHLGASAEVARNSSSSFKIGREHAHKHFVRSVRALHRIPRECDAASGHMRIILGSLQGFIQFGLEVLLESSRAWFVWFQQHQ